MATELKEITSSELDDYFIEIEDIILEEYDEYRMEYGDDGSAETAIVKNILSRVAIYWITRDTIVTDYEQTVRDYLFDDNSSVFFVIPFNAAR